MINQTAKMSQSLGSSQKLEGIEAMQGFMADLVGATRCRLTIMTQALEPELLHNEDIIRRMAHFVRGHARNRIRVITCDTRRAEQRGHRLVNLARQLPSYLEIRQLPLEVRQAYPQAQRTFVIADDRHGLVWVNAAKPLATAYWQQPGLLRSDLYTFDTLWELSHPVMAFRRLSL